MSKTIFVIGAGAGKEFGLPLGYELKKVISEKLYIRTNEWGAVKSYGDNDIGTIIEYKILKNEMDQYDDNKLKNHSIKISKALPLSKSIDNFVHSHKGNEYVEKLSKVAITKAILDAERSSKLYCKADEQLSFDEQIENTWMVEFFKLMNTGSGLDDLQGNLKKVSVVNFNYDRCFEHFFYQALKTYYPLGDSEVVDIISKLQIYHPYGKVGDLPWESGSHGVGFGHKPEARDLIGISKRIKTFTQGVQEAALKQIRKEINNAEKVIFLGFGFHEINMDLLYGESGLFVSNNTGYFGTAYKESDDSVDNITKILSRRSSVDDISHIKIRNDLDCLGLFREYSRTLKI